MILAGDIGGTSARLALFEAAPGRLAAVVERTFPSRDYAGLAEVVNAFAEARAQPVARACFGIAGPVRNGRVKTPNLPWHIDAAALARDLDYVGPITLINDLEANAYGIATLGADDFAVLNAGAPVAAGNAAVISAGTGLGQAGLYWDGERHRVFACEGGHADFAPRDELEAALLRYLLYQFERVSYERVLSGPGLAHLYAFLRDTGRAPESPWVVERMHTQDPAAVVTQAALGGSCGLCVRTLDLFISLYGAEAGNTALKLMATGGVYLGGGIAPKIVDKLKEGPFMEAFARKGRMRSLLKAIPVRVILNPHAALRGAARYAAMQTSLMA